MKIKEVVDQHKETINGSFTQKELLIYCIDRLDKIYEKFEKGSQKISENKASINNLKWALGIIFTIILAFVTTVTALQ